MNWRLIVICLFSLSLKLTPSTINQAFAADASDIASCGAISGYGFIHLQGLIAKNTAGWDEEKISKGRFSAKRLRNGKLDILYIDATNNINSVQQEGGHVVLLRVSSNNAAILAHYPGEVV